LPVLPVAIEQRHGFVGDIVRHDRFRGGAAFWQKGGVANANGRLRRWLPRQIDIDKVSDEEIQDIVLAANLTPRKCLGFKTPFQAILRELGRRAPVFL
jgi:IS30 family transposase